MPDDLRHLVDALQTVPQEAGVPKPDPILVADGVRRHFGGLTAVDVDHVEIQRGTITALIGPNGAGKTTFFNLLTGFDKPNEGQWTFEGRQLAGVRPHKVAQYGMVRTFQPHSGFGRRIRKRPVHFRKKRELGNLGPNGNGIKCQQINPLLSEVG